MSGSGLFRQSVPAGPDRSTLQKFLQRGFEIRELAGRLSDFRDLGTDEPFDDGARGLKAGIQIYGSENRFQRVHQKRLFSPAAGFFLSFSEMEVPAEVELLRVPHKVRRADKKSLQPGKFTFGKRRTLAAERVADHEAKYRVSKKLQLLVVFSGPLLVGMRTVGQSALQ